MKKRAEISGLLLMFASVTLLVFFIIKPSESRWLGAAYGLLYWFKLQFGVTMYFVSFLLWFFGIQKFMHGAITGRNVEYLGYFALLLFSNLFFEILNSTGGLFGSFVASKTVLLLGNAGALLLSVFGTLIGASAAFNILLAPLFVAFLSGAANAAFAVLKFVVFSAAFVVTFVFKAFSAACHYAFNYVRSIFSNGGEEDAPAVQDFDGRAERVEMFKKDPELETPLSDAAAQEKTLEEKLFSNFKKGDEDYIVRNPEPEPQSRGISLDGYNVERLENIARLQNINKKSVEPETDLCEENAEGEDESAVRLESRASGTAAGLNLNEVPITRAYDAPRGAAAPSADEETLLKNYYSKNSGGKFGGAKREKSVRPDSYDEYDYPDFNAILKPVEKIEGISEEELKYNAEKLVTTLKNFNVEVKIAHITCGPTVTRYELQPASGVKVSKVVGLADDLALALATSSLRMEAPIPGKAAIGVEVPNTKPVPVFFSELITLPEFNESKSPLLFALGKTITGQPIIADLRNMPHLLVAGTTGSGKSVCINTIIASILFHARPDEVRFVMVDPKMVELTGYNDIPHLIHPVVVKVKDVPFLLEWGVYEMERRYRLLSAFGVRAIDGFNAMVEEYNAGKYELNEKEPEILVELAI
ncbi:MAG TPA: DNA translocase FtsK, partial [Candidatus Wallbacteria bacterium]|nr:DNA translocase FtsK [Candidatus Wallbacteria bacterium]